jgi:RsiW-degrading membrane proteinase PrsW (M82 family)
MTLTYLSVSLSAGIWLYFIYRYDRFEPEPVRWVLIIGAAGGILSSIPAALLNTGAASYFGIGDFINNPAGIEASGRDILLFSLFVGFNEEFWKTFLAVILLRRFRHFNEPIDALIYSMSIALAFAAFENISYTVAGGYGTLIVRSFTAVPLHAGLASIWGSGIAKAKYYKDGRYFTTLFPYVAAASLLHALYNYIQFINYDNPVSLIIALIFVFFIISYAAGRLRYFQKESPFRRSGLCNQCGTLNNYFARYCKNCGSYIVTDYYTLCTSCGIRNRKGLSSCRQCGGSIIETGNQQPPNPPEG